MFSETFNDKGLKYVKTALAFLSRGMASDCTCVHTHIHKEFPKKFMKNVLGKNHAWISEYFHQNKLIFFNSIFHKPFEVSSFIVL